MSNIMYFRPSYLQAILLFLLLFIAPHIQAHEIRPAIVNIDINENAQPATFKISIKLNLEALISKVANEKNSNDSENADYYDRLRKMPAASLEREFDHFQSYFLKNITLSFGNENYPLSVSTIAVPPIGDLDLARDSYLYIEGNIPEGKQTVSWKWDESFGNAALRVNTITDPELYSSYLLKGKASEKVKFIASSTSINDKPATKNYQKQAGWSMKWKTFKNYLQVGFVHIVPLGIDHILFVVGLFLLSASVKPLLMQVTTFTLAHSVTLVLGIYGIISVPSSIVEPLIAASIIYVAIENIYSTKIHSWRLVIVFLFGLLHGLGFASVLTEIGLSSDYYATGLIAFNIGVELGQLTVITACFLLVGFWFRNKHWYRSYITIPASLLIALIASYWFIERIGWI